MAGFFIFYLLLASEVPARGLDINVDVIKLREISCGVETDVGKAIARRIVIRNTSETARRYLISFHKPSAIGFNYRSLHPLGVPIIS
ncbi:MAG: hypothetical protein WC947_10745 [Elusimicrobiota bacterium]